MAEPKAKTYRLVRSNLHEQVYGIMKEMIADQRFNPGGTVNVEKLSRELGVSHTPIWEAVRRLEQEGIVVHTPYKGIRVRELTRKTAIELYVVREALESLAARLGAQSASPDVIARMEKLLEEQTKVVEREDAVGYSRTDHDFHMLICESAENELLADTLEGLRYKALTLAFRLSPFFPEFLALHHEILDAFRKRDEGAAEEATRRHHRRMIEIIETTPWKDA